MMRSWLVLGALFAGLARGAAPSSSADRIVNGANFAPGATQINFLIPGNLRVQDGYVMAQHALDYTGCAGRPG